MISTPKRICLTLGEFMVHFHLLQTFNSLMSAENVFQNDTLWLDVFQAHRTGLEIEL